MILGKRYTRGLRFVFDRISSNEKNAPYRGFQITSPRGFRELSWTRPSVYDIPFHENFSWTGQIARGGEVI